MIKEALDYLIKYIMTHCKVSGPCLVILIFIGMGIIYIVDQVKDIKEQNRITAEQNMEMRQEISNFIVYQKQKNEGFEDDIGENRKDIDMIKRAYIK